MKLRKLLKARKLPVAGKKAEIIDRLVDSIKTEHGIRDCRVNLNRINLNEIRTSKKQSSQRSNNAIIVVDKQSPENEEPPEKKIRKSNFTEDKSKKTVQRNRRQKQTKKIAATALMLKPALQKFEMVWAHIKGFRNWPGIIEGETPKGKYKIHFFGDYTTSEVSKSKIMHLLEGFKDYVVMTKPTPLLVKAITEAQIFVLDKERQECPICKMLLMKANSNKKFH